MSPHEMDECRRVFDASCRIFGWTMKVVEVSHERDWDCSWEENKWYGPDGKYLFSEKDLTPGLVAEIIRLSDLIPG